MDRAYYINVRDWTYNKNGNRAYKISVMDRAYNIRVVDGAYNKKVGNRAYKISVEDRTDNRVTAKHGITCDLLQL